MISTFSYNVDLAKIVGPLSAIFISLIDFYQKNNNGEKVSLDRNTIYNNIGVDEQTQLSIENNLTLGKILDVKGLRGPSDKNYYYINYNELDKVLKEDRESFTINVVNNKINNKKVDKETKKEKTLKILKNCVKVEDQVIKQYIFDWIDSVIESGNYLTTQSVKINIDQLVKFSTDQSKLIEVLLIATKSSWKDLTWAMTRVAQNKTLKDNNNFSNYSDIKFSNNKNDQVVQEAF